MDYASLVSAINENLAALQSLSRTQVFKDETGVNRIILGKLPDGTWGLVISKPTYDVLRLFV